MFTICSTVMYFSQSLDIIHYHSTLYDLGGLNGPNRFSHFHAVFGKFCIVSSSFRNFEAATAVCFCLNIYIIFLFLFNSLSSSVSSYLHSRISIIDQYIETSILFGLNFFKNSFDVFILAVIALNGDTLPSTSFHLQRKSSKSDKQISTKIIEI